MEVPFSFQAWVFQELAAAKLDQITKLISDYSNEIIDRAKVRHNDGFLSYGSEMYTWSSDKRWQETLDELADALVYMCSGPVNPEWKWEGGAYDSRAEGSQEHQSIREERPERGSEEEGA